MITEFSIWNALLRYKIFLKLWFSILCVEVVRFVSAIITTNVLFIKCPTFALYKVCQIEIRGLEKKL